MEKTVWSSFLPAADQQLGHVCERKEVDYQMKINRLRVCKDVVTDRGRSRSRSNSGRGGLQVAGGSGGLASVEKGWIQGAKQTWQ